MKKITNFFKLIKLFNRSTINLAWYKIVENIMNFAYDVKANGKPMITKIACIDMSDEKTIGNFDVVSLWAGVGDANPLERIRALKNQTTELKRLLELSKEKLDKEADIDLIVNIDLAIKYFD